MHPDTLSHAITDIARAPLDLRTIEGDRRRPEGAVMRAEITLLLTIEWEIELAGHPEIAANVRRVRERLIEAARS